MLLLAWFLISMAAPCAGEKFDPSKNVSTELKTCDVTLTAEIRDMEEENVTGLSDFIPRLSEQLLRLREQPPNYAVALFLTIDVHACNKTQTLRFPDGNNSKLLRKAFVEIGDANRWNECESISDRFKLRHEYHLQDPKVRIKMAYVRDDGERSWLDAVVLPVAKEAMADGKGEDIGSEIFIGTSDYGAAPKKMALFYRNSGEPDQLAWPLGTPTVSWAALADEVRKVIFDHLSLCKYVRHREATCLYNAGDQCGQFVSARPMDPTNHQRCREHKAFDPMCKGSKSTNTCDIACEAHSFWTHCNASGCTMGYQYKFINSTNMSLYEFCPEKVKPTLHRCGGCSEMEAWEIAVIVILVILGVAAIVGLVVFFLVIQPRRRAAAAEASSSSSDGDEEAGKGKAPISAKTPSSVGEGSSVKQSTKSVK